MTPVYLIKALADEIREAVKDFKFEAEYQPDKKVSVYEMYLEKSQFEVDTFYPLCLIELLGIDDNDEDSIATFIITAGVYAGEDDTQQGFRDLLNLVQAIRMHLQQHRLIKGQMVYNSPLTIEFPQEQPVPFLFASLMCSYRIYRPVPTLDAEFI